MRITPNRSRNGSTRRKRALRSASVAVFGLLVVVATFSALHVERGIQSGRSSYQEAIRYEHVRLLVTDQESLLDDYAHRPAAAREFEQNDLRIATLFQAIGNDVPLYEAFKQFSGFAHRYVQQVSIWPVRAARLKHRHVDPSFDRVDRLAARDARRQTSISSADLSDLQQTQEAVLILLPTAFALSGGLLLLLSARRRRAVASEAEARAEMAALERAARIDSLTGVGTHRAFMEALLGELEAAGSSPLSLVLVDIDDLKLVNDTLGHQRGDELLRSLADALREAAQHAQLSFRMGGDEFAIVQRGPSWEGFAAAQRVGAALSDGGPSVAMGVAEAEAGDTPESLIRRADHALIAAKRSARQIIVYSPDLEIEADVDAIQDESNVQRLASSLARAVDAKDSYTRSHCETVSTICALVAAQLGLEGERISKLRIAGLLHDAGKIGTPDAILNKPGKLTDAEYEEIKKHPVLGAEIVEASRLDEHASWIRHHHERIDGGGYPDGLRGDQIPLESRIILVADAFEALTADRPYRRGRPTADALEEIQRNAGTQFDRDCVEALFRVLGYGETRPAYQSIQPAQDRRNGSTFSGSVDVAASSPK